MRIIKTFAKYVAGKISCLAIIRVKEDYVRARKNLEEYQKRPEGTCITTNGKEVGYDLQIIIPCYNAEKYIGQCIKSVITQESPYKVLVSVVNDGSIDKTAKILDDILKQNSSKIDIEIISQENRGFSGARNTALKKLRGRYICFLDSDDILPKDSIKILLDNAYNMQVDILQGSWYTFNENCDVLKKHIISEVGILSDNENSFSGYPWAKLYKNNTLEKFKFPENFWFEDTPISFILAALPYRFGTIEDIVYGYRINPNGITANANKSRKSVDTYWITEECLREFKSFGVPYNQRAYEYFLRQCITNWKRTRQQPVKIRKSIFVLEIELIKIYFKGFSTKNYKMKNIEATLHKGQFLKFELLLLSDSNY